MVLLSAISILPAFAAIFGALAAITLVAVFAIYLIVPAVKGVGMAVRHVARFIWGEISDLLRLFGAAVLFILYIPVILGCVVIGRWSAANHYGAAFMGEARIGGMCLYRILIGHPARFLFLRGLTEGLERRLPAVVAAAPSADMPRPLNASMISHNSATSDVALTGMATAPVSSTKRGQFEGYRIIGSLAAGGSGAKLYVAEPDAVKAAQFARAGVEVGQVVIKSFSIFDGSTVPQIVRESRSLEVAKRLGLILDHDLTNDRFYYVMRYVPGENLSLITRQLHASSEVGGLGNLQLASALSYASDLVATLSLYHRGGLWHKDVKPDNIIVATRTDRRAHLVDFGLVSSLRSAMTLTTHGTEYFRDPEMVRLALKGVKVHEVDGTKFDLYAAGAVLYSMIEDSFPAHGVLSSVTKRCPDAVKWVIRRAMTEYDKRYVNADAMLADLQYVALAADPFAVKPFELPSMRDGLDADLHGVDAAIAAAGAAVAAAGMTVAQVAAASPVPPRPQSPAAVPPPLPASRQVPRMKVTNWWSGKVIVEGHDNVPASTGPFIPPHVAAKVKNAAESVNAGLKSAMAAVGLGAAVAPAAAPSPAYAAPADAAHAVPPIPARPRRAASDQIEAARARVRAVRARAHARVGVRKGSHLPSPRHFQTGAKGGVAVALLICFGAVIGGVAWLTGAPSSSSNVFAMNDMGFEFSMDGDAALASSHPAWDESAVFDDSTDFAHIAVTQAVESRDAANRVAEDIKANAAKAVANAKAEVQNRERAKANSKSRRTPTAPQIAPLPPARPGIEISGSALRITNGRHPVAVSATLPSAKGRIALISDVKQPWSQSHSASIVQVVTHLLSNGWTIVGETITGSDEALAPSPTALESAIDAAGHPNSSPSLTPPAAPSTDLAPAATVPVATTPASMGDSEEERNIAIAAGIRHAVGQVPADSADLMRNAQGWLSANPDTVAIVWIAPPIADPDGALRIVVITRPDSPARDELIRAMKSDRE